MELFINDVRERNSERGLQVPDTAVASAIGALNAGKHVALLASQTQKERVSAFAESLADSAATLKLCVGWVNLHATAGALVSVRDLIQRRFVADLWLILIDPSPTAISRIVDDVRDVWDDSDARLVVATSVARLRQADLSPAARRALVPVLV